ncbi:SDR family oxidoreductase [Opitutus terrae]|uniref:Short-chain dehydrogenase/reductase SDR n=1 Tax=Opitutus terrae (strain DSM 11246 / JCM 15787 / PB90-1) TaxID=452637 RepID=B1ZTR7_OPITP|nr:SDR family oxidoreductase [Opitutus terrae]ACB74853.1 short-chain dehydrogenase/reductase SDR [Opitutus terrae PB90-1]
MNNPRPSAKSAGENKPLVLITGASQGIGEAIAQVFARELPGVRLALVARSEAKLAGVAQACGGAGAEADVFGCDVTDAGSVARMAEVVTQRFGLPDVLINNAGGFVPKKFAQTTVEDFDAMVAVNLRSAFLVTHAFLPALLKRGSGDVFFMSSIAGLAAYPASAAYTAAKFGVTGLAKALRAETRDAGLRVCCVHPGATWSPSWSGSGVAPERIMPTEDVAQAFYDVYRMSRRTVVEEIVLRPRLGDI